MRTEAEGCIFWFIVGNTLCGRSSPLTIEQLVVMHGRHVVVNISWDIGKGNEYYQICLATQQDQRLRSFQKNNLKLIAGVKGSFFVTVDVCVQVRTSPHVQVGECAS